MHIWAQYQEWCVAAELTPRSDGELLELFLTNRNEQAFLLLMQRHGARVYACCLFVSRCAGLAEEAWHETFVALAVKGGQVKRDVGGWLLRTARNMSLGLLKKRQSTPPPEAAQSNASLPPDEYAMKVEQWLVLTKAMAALPSAHRQALELVYWEGRTHAEAAQTLGIPKGTLDAWIKRDLEKLREALSRHGTLPGAALATGLLTGLAQAVSPSRVRATLASAVQAETLPATLPWALGTAVKVFLLLSGAGALGALLWALSPDRPQPLADRPVPTPTPTPAAVAAPMESLPQRNLRLWRHDYLPRVKQALAGLLIGGGEVVEVECHTELTWLRATVELRHKNGFKQGIRISYDMQSRMLSVEMDRTGKNEWRVVDLRNPIKMEIGNTGREVTYRLKAFTDLEQVFDAFPGDARGPGAQEEYRIREGFPAGLLYVAGNSRFLFASTESDHLFARIVEGSHARWKSIGGCVERLAANETSLFTVRPGHGCLEVLTRPADDQDHPWQLVGRVPRGVLEVLAASQRHVYLQTSGLGQGRKVWMLPAAPGQAAAVEIPFSPTAPLPDVAELSSWGGHSPPGFPPDSIWRHAQPNDGKHLWLLAQGCFWCFAPDGTVRTLSEKDPGEGWKTVGKAVKP